MTDEATDDVTVADHPERLRYEIHVDGRLAGFVTYARHGDRVELVHTEIDPDFEHRGLAAQLARATLDDLRGRGLRVTPTCRYVSGFINQHPEYLDLVDPENRGSLDE
jgi:predicted GNAT family acetyltransferase